MYGRGNGKNEQGMEMFKEICMKEAQYKLIHGHYSFEPKPPEPVGLLPGTGVGAATNGIFMDEMHSIGISVPIEMYPIPTNAIDIARQIQGKIEHNHVWKDTKDGSGDKMCRICGIRAMVGRLYMDKNRR